MLLACPSLPSYLFCCIFYLDPYIDVSHTCVLAYPFFISQLPIWLKKVNILIPQLCLLWYLTYLYHLSYLCCHLHICTFSQVTSSESSYTCELSPGYIFCAISHLCTVSWVLSPHTCLASLYYVSGVILHLCTMYWFMHIVSFVAYLCIVSSNARTCVQFSWLFLFLGYFILTFHPLLQFLWPINIDCCKPLCIFHPQKLKYFKGVLSSS